MPDQPDYRDTVFLPKTDFPMKAGLAQKEPGILADWQAQGLYEKLREARKGREKFIFHDGPPYANGNIHIGHALNKTLKDFVVRTQSLLGKDAPFVPGWDCHGLPIEWKIEEQYRKKKRSKDDVPAAEFRAECRAYAAHWVDVQREEFKRLGIVAEWDKPYLTMDFAAEAVIVEEFLKFADSGQVYRGAKPVMWSPVEKTALAEAEVEYQDITSTQIDVAFEIVESPIPELVDAYAVVWTTTPWTIPVNQAIAYGEEVEYGLYSINLDTGRDDGDHSRANELVDALRGTSLEQGKRILVARSLAESISERLKQHARTLLPEDLRDVDLTVELSPVALDGDYLVMGKQLAGTIARHPMHNHLRRSSEGWSLSRADGSRSNSGIDPSLRWGDENWDEDRQKAEWEKALEFFARPRPLIAADHVTTDAGTGLVHMAPDHGEEDFLLCKANGIDPVFAVEDDGVYREDWAWLPRGGEGSNSVINKKFNAPDGPICSDLRAAGALLSASDDFQHSYPHSWRSKAKVIFRCTPQWFVAMDEPISPSPSGEGLGVGAERAEASVQVASDSTTPNPSSEEEGLTGSTLRETALAEIDKTRFVPERGHRRLRSMVEGRPDWVLSRQRAWGVPITLYVDKHGQYLNDPEVNARIVAAVRAGGADAWFAADHQALLGNQYNLDDYEIVTDILDVWFDSGSTHAFVLESGKWPDLSSPADLYLEGSDQHRGWFQSSLLESCGTRGRAPYRQLLTHGMTLDSNGLKMSKSIGNTLDPQKIIDVSGADILRLWVASVDFTEDHRIGDEILKGVSDTYRKLRNTFRYMLGALSDFDENERVDVAEMPELERYVLHLLAGLDATLKEAVNDYAFNRYVRALTDFASEDLSAFFFDIRKDSLYCDAPGDPKRRAYRTVLDTLFHALVRYAAPILVFTAEEVWKTRYPDGDSVHLLEWPDFAVLLRHSRESGNDEDWLLDSELAGNWKLIRSVREQAFNVLEPMRRDKIIGSSLQADLKIELYKEDNLPILQDVDLSQIFICAEVGVHIRTRPERVVATQPDEYSKYSYGGAEISGFISSNHKCGRCWRLLPEVTEDGALCDRCTAVVAGQTA